mmetsp:Transcript_23015/g.66400  ORF Transcript_23015/g.66400 Transcript_23015/m.66400 type:complete len:265 (-) Transcript_23015:61-855(-)|eukprot:CAMPEP_0168392782 /NCGR_PEP_ID=MMETSP0228-20121227/18674_1 /TAXON_ID=133427 /ORGANISM="Protoceratium reticulatum, Strain CCCM 535 (=CCMP 1889)" /LENGTH=264 /DNA_ID=CAMNT_0008406131 /DNA_START=61 /DNA_END=855 /DNA_ORIENTATION=-
MASALAEPLTGHVAKDEDEHLLEKLFGAAALANAVVFATAPLTSMGLYFANPSAPETAMALFRWYGAFVLFLSSLMWHPTGGKGWAVGSLVYAALGSYLAGYESMLPCHLMAPRVLIYIPFLLGMGFCRAQRAGAEPDSTPQRILCKFLAVLYAANGVFMVSMPELVFSIYFPGATVASLGLRWFQTILLDSASVMLVISALLLFPSNSSAFGIALIVQGIIFSVAHLGVAPGRYMDLSYLVIPYVPLLVCAGAWLLLRGLGAG